MSRAHSRGRVRERARTVLVVFVLAIGSCAAPAQPVSVEEADVVLNSYFSALRVGNLSHMGNLLGGELRSKRARLLRNPEYRFTLVQTYGNADFVVTDYEMLESGGIAVNVDIWLDNTEKIRQRLTLERLGESSQMRIVDSEVVP
ncbi:hypothetical protein [Thiocapsa rosea]|uniref:Uncharacterized protein n=1 Tax=Thiocapsa rosea TaxID=69360 RepID=A0A495VG95_9GAMM|nr:hypothetical protein [Thiocapsa rosea]RKT47465.1 hypothetical protein BDD21_5053 [Thiocapsa rosea]